MIVADLAGDTKTPRSASTEQEAHAVPPPLPTADLLFGRTWGKDITVGHDTFMPEHEDLFTINTDGEAQNLTHGRGLQYIGSWSPDGSTIVFSRLELSPRVRGNYSLFLMSAKGTRIRRLTRCLAPGCYTDISAAWSPNGEWIAFSRDCRIFTISPEGRGLRPVAGSSDFCAGQPVWSPDGARLAFSGYHQDEDVANVYVVAPDGRGRVRLTDCEESSCGFWGITWAPDGRRIAYVSAEGDLRVIRPDGSDDRLLRECQPPRCLYESVSWSPDGKWLAFTEGGDIFMAAVNGAVVHRLTRGKRQDCCVAWRPE